MSDTNSREIATEIPVSIERPTPALTRFFVAIGIVILAAIWLVVGFALLGLSAAVAILAAVGFLLWWAWAVIVTVFFHLTGRRYPLWFLFPLGPTRARMALRDAGNASVAPTMAALARGTILLFGPLVFLLRLFFGWKQSRERRAHTALIDLPLRGSILFRATLRAIIDVAGHWKMLIDGFHESTSEYDEWVGSAFTEISAFVDWWPLEELPVESYCVYTPLPFPVTSNAALEASLDLQPSPDPRGFPGLASAVIRRTRVTGLRDLFHSASEIGGMGDPNLDGVPDCGVVRIVRTTNQSGERWIVQVPSTGSWQPRAGRAPNDITTDVSAVAGRETSLLRGVLAAMAKAGIPSDAPVLLSGFSLGGIVAAQLATGKYRVPGFAEAHHITHLICAGSPIARFGVADGVRVLSLEHELDPVHRLDGRPRATDTAAAVPWVTVHAGPPLPPNYSLGQTHHLPSYAETGNTFTMELDDPVALDYWHGADGAAGASEFFAGTQAITDYAVVREGDYESRPAVPAYVQVDKEGRLRGRLRAFLRRLDGVIAADVYLSRSGFPTTKSWSVDLLVDDLDQAMTPIRRQFSYEGLLAIAEVRGAVALNMRVMARNQRAGHVAAALSRAQGGAIREDIDIDGVVRLSPLQPLTADAETIVTNGPNPRTTFLYSGNPFA